MRELQKRGLLFQLFCLPLQFLFHPFASLMSRIILENPVSAPASSCKAVNMTLAQYCDPSSVRAPSLMLGIPMHRSLPQYLFGPIRH